MKKISIILMLVIMGCNNTLPTCRGVVVNKFHLPNYNGLSRYYYNDNKGFSQEFVDSSHFYMVGDTIFWYK